MENSVENTEDKNVYRVQGFTCTNCAGIFEKNVKGLPGVKDAQVNFGASKITVYGSTTVKDLEKAGAFESLKVTPEKQRAVEKKKPLWQEHWNVLLSAILLATGYFLSEQYGEESVLSAVTYVASILIGGYELFKKGIRNLFRLQFDMNTLTRTSRNQ